MSICLVISECQWLLSGFAERCAIVCMLFLVAADTETSHIAAKKSILEPRPILVAAFMALAIEVESLILSSEV